MKHRAPIHARVSTAVEQSPEMQLRDLRELGERRGFEIVREYVDTGFSGATDSRPRLAKKPAENLEVLKQPRHQFHLTNRALVREGQAGAESTPRFL